MRLGKFLTTFRRKREMNYAQPKEGVFVVERRRNPRISLELPLDCSRADRVDDKEIYSGMTANVSVGGLLVYLSQAMEIGTLLKTESFFLKGLQLNTIKTIAKVVWSDLAANGRWGKYRYGLQFHSFREGDIHKLKILLKKWKKLYDKVANNVSRYHP